MHSVNKNWEVDDRETTDLRDDVCDYGEFVSVDDSEHGVAFIDVSCVMS